MSLQTTDPVSMRIFSNRSSRHDEGLRGLIIGANGSLETLLERGARLEAPKRPDAGLQ
jgi:hypothetical protein